MKTSTKIWIVVIAVVLVLTVIFVGYYNRFISLQQNVESKWSETENQYQRQADLIINELIPTISSSVSVETKFVKDVIDARTRFNDAASQYDKDAAGTQMNNGISALVSAVAEDYPTLQASTHYTQIIDEMAGTQNRIATARGRYIEAVQSFNTAIKKFPGNIIAGMFGFEEVKYYKAEAGTTTPMLGTGELPQ
ncbi:MAG: LemA family protein [Candidatus Pacearchaeota archaeon]